MYTNPWKNKTIKTYKGYAIQTSNHISYTISKVMEDGYICNPVKSEKGISPKIFYNPSDAIDFIDNI